MQFYTGPYLLHVKVIKPKIFFFNFLNNSNTVLLKKLKICWNVLMYPPYRTAKFGLNMSIGY